MSATSHRFGWLPRAALMLLGKYAAKPSIPYLTSLAMLGYGIAGGLGPYLAITLRDVGPRVHFAVLTTLDMISAESRVARRTAVP